MHRFLKKFVRFLLWILGLLLYPVIFLVNLTYRRKRVPPISNPLLLLSATKLSKKIRRKEIKCVDVISAYIERCKTVNPIINAIVEPRYEIAMDEARNVDTIIDSGKYNEEELEKSFPLLGIPISVKESISVAGMSNEAGRLRTMRIPAMNDAECISKIRTAGGIPILVSNTPELCMCWETFNYVTGTTKNPYNTKRTCGGSSGGEAALISSGASLIGMGSDIAGSLRIPAMYTGIFGFKPSPYSISNIGHMPSSDSKDWNKVFTLGPLTRYAEDLPLITKVVNKSCELELSSEKKTPIQEINFYYMEGDGSGATGRINSHMREALEKVKLHFTDKFKIHVKKAEIKNMQYSFDTTLLKLLSIDGVETIFSKYNESIAWKSILKETIKKIFGCSHHALTSIAYGYLKKITQLISKDTYEKSEKLNAKIQKEFQDLLQDNGVCFYPTYTKTATKHHEYLLNLLDSAYLFIFNGLGFPVVNCPVGFARNGMPVGIQIFTNPGCDHLLLSVAQEIEEAFGGWIPPS